jgi:hypothetical protein
MAWIFSGKTVKVGMKMPFRPKKDISESFAFFFLTQFYKMWLKS